jgi:hypothetical protein
MRNLLQISKAQLMSNPIWILVSFWKLAMSMIKSVQWRSIPLQLRWDTRELHWN